MTEPAQPQAPAEPGFQVYDAEGNPHSVPVSQAAQHLASGKYGLPAGSQVPVRLRSGQIGTVPIEKLGLALSQKAQIVSAEEHAKAQQEANYGSLVQQLETAGIGALEGASQGVSNVAIRGILGHKAAEYVKNLNETNKVSRGVGNVTGMGLAALATGGESAAAELGAGAEAAEAGLGAAKVAEAVPGAVEAARTAQAATEAPGLLRQAASVVGAPTSLVGHVGNLVERQVASLLPEEATTLAGRLTSAALKSGARGASEGALMGAGEYASNEALDPNPKLSGEKLMMSMGYGALLGGATGGVLGAGGELGSEVLGRLAPRVKGFAGEQAFRAFNPRGKAAEIAESMPGGAKAFGQEMIDSGVVRGGDNIENIAQRTGPMKETQGQLLDEKYGLKADQAGFQGPKLKNVVETLGREVMPRLEALPSFNQGALSRIAGLQDDLAKAALPGMNDAERKAFNEAMVLGISPGEALKIPALKDVSLSFQGARELRARIDDAIRYTKPALGAPANEVNDALKGARTALEQEIEGALDKATSKLEGGSLLPAYQADKLKYRQLALADRMAEDAVNARLKNRAISPTDYLAGIGGAALASGHPVAALTSVASAVAHRQIRERGNATAAVLMDKIAGLGAVRTAISKVERETARGVERAVGNEERVIPRLRLKVFEGDYRAKRDAVMHAVTNDEEHAEDIQAVTAPFGRHSPDVAQAFHLAALKATQYLASQLPKPRDPTIETMTPRLADYTPTSVERAAFERKFNAVHDPVSILHGASLGSVTRDEVDAVKATHPEWLGDTRQAIRLRLQDMTKPLPAQRLIALSKFLEEPVTPIMRPDFISARQAAYQSRPQPQTAPKPNSASKATPKADKLSFAKASSLSIGGSREST